MRLTINEDTGAYLEKGHITFIRTFPNKEHIQISLTLEEFNKVVEELEEEEKNKEFLEELGK